MDNDISSQFLKELEQANSSLIQVQQTTHDSRKKLNEEIKNKKMADIIELEAKRILYQKF